MSDNTKHLGVALAYAARGWLVLPLHCPVGGGTCSCSKGGKCDSSGKHPRTQNGHKDATTDENNIRKWWEKWPDANIGIRTGIRSGIFVLDVDPRNGGDESLNELEKEFGPMPPTLEAATGGGGRHLVFQYPGGAVRGKLPLHPGLDIKGEGGLIVAAPSKHKSGGVYRWVNDLDPIPPPDWLVELINRPKPSSQAASDRSENSNIIAEGERNTTLTSIGGRLRRLGLTEDKLNARLQSLNEERCQPPLGGDEVQGIAKSVSKYDSAPADFTDTGNAMRLVARHGHNLRYCHALREWYVWTGAHWRKDESAEIERLAKETIHAMRVEAAQVSDDQFSRKMKSWAKQSESGNRLRYMIQLAQSEENIPVRPADLDTNSWIISVGNGTIDLKTGKLRPHRRTDLCTKHSPVPFDPEHPCPRWEQFLSEVFQGDDEMVRFLQRVIGYSLTGSTAEQAMFILHGIGANGKSTLIETIHHLLGDYGRVASEGTFLAKLHDGSNFDLARLRGARFVSVPEIEDNRRLSESLVKQVTAGDEIAAREIYRKHFQFNPQFKLFIATNHKPNIYGDDHAIWRRIRLVPFARVFGEEEQDRNLLGKLADELAGILAWAVQGCVDWQREGLSEPEAVVHATQAYRSELDELGAFLDECCELRADAFVLSGDLYRAYKEWSERRGTKPMTQNRLSRRLKDRQFESKRAPGGGKERGLNGWIGIELVKDAKQQEPDF